MQNNWDTIKEELMNTSREGIEALVSYLDTSDFKTAPASTKHHLSIEGGLMQHSLNVLKFARNINKDFDLKIDDNSLVLAGLLHDLCKVNYYEMGWEWDKEVKDKTGKWEKKDVWKVKDALPLGHGEKSAILASSLVELTPDELAGIRWHMLKWDVSEYQKYTLQDAMVKYPLIKVVAIADQMAELFETINERT